jgi:hypothetical protein
MPKIPEIHIEMPKISTKTSKCQKYLKNIEMSQISTEILEKRELIARLVQTR